MRKRCGTHQDLEYQMMLTNLLAANLSLLTLKSYKNVFYFCLFTEKKKLSKSSIIINWEYKKPNVLHVNTWHTEYDNNPQ